MATLGRQAPPGFPQPPHATVPVTFRVGQRIEAPVPIFGAYPSFLRVGSDNVTETIRMTSSGEDFAFRIENVPEWADITPRSGTTPVDLSVTVRAPLASSQLSLNPTIVVGDRRLAGPRISVIDEDFENWGSPSSYFSAAPGMPMWFAMPVPSIALREGTRLEVLGKNVPILRQLGDYFEAQLPFDLPTGFHDITLFNPVGKVIGTNMLSVQNALLSQPIDPVTRRVQFPILTEAGVPTTEAHTGDIIHLKLIGHGAVIPAIEAGTLPSPETPVIPALPVTAMIGGKPAAILSARLDSELVGVLDIWLRVPMLFADIHNIQIFVGSSAGPKIAIRVLPPLARDVLGNGEKQ